MTEDWKPVDSQVLVDAWEEIKDCAEGIQKDLACPDDTISKMLRSVAETFDNTVEDILNKAEEDWEDEKQMYYQQMIPDFIPSPEPVGHIGVWKTIIGLFIVLFATFVGVEIRLGNDDDET